MNPFERSQTELKAMPEGLRVAFEAVLGVHELIKELFEKGALGTMYDELARIGHDDLVVLLRMHYANG